MLHVLFYVSAAGSFDKLIDTEGGAQQDRLEGGAQTLALGLAASLGERVRLGAPVRRIEQRGESVRVLADGVEVEAQRAIVAVPPAIAAADRVRPAAARAAPAARRAACGPAALNKCIALYEEPFWRDDGLSGESVTDSRAGDADLRLLAAGRLGGGDARFRRRARGARDGGDGAGRAPGGGARLLRAALRPAGRAAARLRRTGLGGRGVVRRRADLELRPRRLDRAAARRCASRSGGSTGPAPRRQPSGAATWRAPCRRASGRRPRSRRSSA